MMLNFEFDENLFDNEPACLGWAKQLLLTNRWLHCREGLPDRVIDRFIYKINP